MTAIDRVLDVIDGGLQSSPEQGYGTDAAPDRCARCQAAEPVKDGDLCAPCRSFLLGDIDTDPAIPTDPHEALQRHLADVFDVPYDMLASGFMTEAEVREAVGLASGGVLVMPASLDERDPGWSDRFLAELMEAMARPIENRGEASSWMPLILRAPADLEVRIVPIPRTWADEVEDVHRFDTADGELVVSGNMIRHDWAPLSPPYDRVNFETRPMPDRFAEGDWRNVTWLVGPIGRTGTGLPFGH